MDGLEQLDRQKVIKASLRQIGKPNDHVLVPSKPQEKQFMKCLVHFPRDSGCFDIPMPISGALTFLSSEAQLRPQIGGGMSRESAIAEWCRSGELPPAEQLYEALTEADGKFSAAEGPTWDFKDQWPFSKSDDYFGGIW
jgi:hypothetical protein